MPYKEKGGTYRGQVVFEGKKHQKRFETKGEAKEWEVAERKRLKSAQHQTLTASCHQAATEYLQYCEKLKYHSITVSNKKKALRELLAAVGNVALEEIDPNDILKKVILAQTTGSLSNERKKHLRAFFRYCQDFHGLRINPVAGIKEVPQDPPQQPVPTHGELAKMLLVGSNQDRKMIVFDSETGGRKEEVLRMTWSKDVDFPGRRVRFGNRKNRKRILVFRWVPLSEEALQALQDQKKTKLPQSDFVWQQRDPKQPNYGSRFTARRKFMRGISKKAGVPDMGFHSLRRYYASKLVEAGMDLKEIQTLMGHGSIATTDKYIKNLKDDLRAEVKENLEPKGKVIMLTKKASQ